MRMRSFNISTVEAASIIFYWVIHETVLNIANALKRSIFIRVGNPVLITWHKSKISSERIGFISSISGTEPVEYVLGVIIEGIYIVSTLVSAVHSAFHVFLVVENVKREVPVSIVKSNNRSDSKIKRVFKQAIRSVPRRFEWIGEEMAREASIIIVNFRAVRVVASLLISNVSFTFIWRETMFNDRTINNILSLALNTIMIPLVPLLSSC